MVRLLLNGDGALLSCSYSAEQNEPRYNATSFHLIPPDRTQGPAAEVGVVPVRRARGRTQFEFEAEQFITTSRRSGARPTCPARV